MAPVPVLLLTILAELVTHEFKCFHWYLTHDVLEGFPHIPKARLENADVHDTVDKLLESYGPAGAVEITLAILRMMNQIHLAERLENDHRKGGAPAEKKDSALQQARDKLKEILKQKYVRVYEGTSMEGTHKFLDDIYTDLYIVEGGTGGVNNDHEVRQIEETFTTPALQETKIECRDIFKVQPDPSKRNRKVLTLGIAGVGKTVSVQKFILDWANGTHNQDIDFIFPIPFRDLNLMTDPKYSLMDLLQNFLDPTDLKTLPCGDGKCMFIFDGLDECRLPLNFKTIEIRDINRQTTLDAVITNLIKGELLPSALIWITSRPAAANQVPRMYIHQVTEVRGFDDPQKEEYFKKRIKDPTQASKIISHIYTSRTLHIMCHIPVFCWISAIVLMEILFKDGKGIKYDTNTKNPTTLTEMYTYFLLFQMNKMNERHDKAKNTAGLVKLGKLAFHQLEKGHLIFYEDDLRDCGIDASEVTEFSVVCTQIFHVESLGLMGKVYSFVHLSIQEFLAAFFVYYSHLDGEGNPFEQKLENLADECKLTSTSLFDLHKTAVVKALQSENGHLDLFLRFLLGLSLESNQGLLKTLLPESKTRVENVTETVEFIKRILNRHILSDRNINLFHCLNELKDGSMLSEIQKYLNVATKSFDTYSLLSDAPWSSVILLLLLSEETQERFQLDQYWGSKDGLERLLPVVKSTRRALLNNCHLTANSCEVLASALSSNSSQVKELDLSKNNLEDSGVKRLSAALESPHCKVETLRLDQCNLSDGSCAVLAAALSSTSQLKELDLSNNDLQDYGVKRLLASQENQQCKLAALRLDQCHLTEDSCTVLAATLSSTSQMKKLDLSNNDLRDSGVKRLLSALENPHCKLETLRLDQCNLTEDSCTVLASALSSNSSQMKELDMSTNDLQDSGVKLLSTALKNPHCKLETLRLSGCLVTKEGCASLASALTANSSHLRKMDLSYNHPGDVGVKLLSARLDDPHCKLKTLNVDHGGEFRIKPGLRKYVCELTLDPNTAHRDLSLSEENRKVTCGEEQPYPDHPERFVQCKQVLCRDGLSGRCYWEAEWRGGARIGMTYKVSRKRGRRNNFVLGQYDKSWTLLCSKESYNACHSYKNTSIPVPSPCSRRVGVYLDWPAGTLSFYSVSSDTLTHLHTFHSTFTKPLYPGFGVDAIGFSVSLCQIT